MPTGSAASSSTWPGAPSWPDRWLERLQVASASGRLSRGLEQLDRVPVGVLDLDLSAARTGLHFVPDVEAGLLQRVDEGGEVRDLQDDAVPTAGLLPLAVRHRSRSRRARTAEQDPGAAEGDARERGELLMLELAP